MKKIALNTLFFATCVLLNNSIRSADFFRGIYNKIRSSLITPRYQSINDQYIGIQNFLQTINNDIYGREKYTFMVFKNINKNSLINATGVVKSLKYRFNKTLQMRDLPEDSFKANVANLVSLHNILMAKINNCLTDFLNNEINKFKEETNINKININEEVLNGIASFILDIAKPIEEQVELLAKFIIESQKQKGETFFSDIVQDPQSLQTQAIETLKLYQTLDERADLSKRRGIAQSNRIAKWALGATAAAGAAYLLYVNKDRIAQSIPESANTAASSAATSFKSRLGNLFSKGAFGTSTPTRTP